MWWSTGSGRIELNITRKQAAIGYHSGQCYSDVVYLRHVPAIRRQLKKLDPAIVAKELEEHAAWSHEELKNHDENLTRLLWIACSDIRDGNV